MVDLLERLPDNFEMITMQLRAKPLLEGEAGPFVVVALQVRSMYDEARKIDIVVEDPCFAVLLIRSLNRCALGY